MPHLNGNDPIQSLGLLESPKEYVTQIDLDVEVHGQGIEGRLPLYVINEDGYVDHLMHTIGPTNFNTYWKVSEVFPLRRNNSPTESSGSNSDVYMNFSP